KAASPTAVGFVDWAGGNYGLAPGSPYKSAGTDGKDPGVDFNALAAAVGSTASSAAGSRSSDDGATPLMVALTTREPDSSAPRVHFAKRKTMAVDDSR